MNEPEWTPRVVPPPRAVRRPTVLRGRAHAKVTLSLRVLGMLPGGYHEIDALTVAASDPHDDVSLVPQRRGTTVAVTPRGAAPALAAHNFAALAVERLRPHLPVDAGGMRVRLHKRIPMGAGLGGGSSDAAAVLALLSRHYRVPSRTVARIAARLGSDVPFGLRGAPVRMRGRGDRLEPVAPFGTRHLVIATPPFGCSTPLVYRAWDELGGPASTRVIGSDLDAEGLRNDLEPAALHIAPGLAAFRDAFGAATGAEPLMLGSGSSYAVLVADADAAASGARRAAAQLGIDTVWAATTLGG